MLLKVSFLISLIFVLALRKSQNKKCQIYYNHFDLSVRNDLTHGKEGFTVKLKVSFEIINFDF